MISKREHRKIRIAYRLNRGAAAQLARELAAKRCGSVDYYESAISRWLRNPELIGTPEIQQAIINRAAELTNRAATLRRGDSTKTSRRK